MVKMAKISEVARVAEIFKIAETEIVIFLETFKIWVFFEK